MSIEKFENNIWKEMLNEFFVELLYLQSSNATEEEKNIVLLKISHVTFRMNGYVMDDCGNYSLESN